VGLDVKTRLSDRRKINHWIRLNKALAVKKKKKEKDKFMLDNGGGFVAI
jgi:hypothetical protein